MHTLRLKLTGRPGAGFDQTCCGARPAEIWDSDDLALHFWLDSGACVTTPAPFDIATLGSLTLEMREAKTATAMLMAPKVLDTFTASTWAAFVEGTGQHGTFLFSDTDTNVVGTLDSVWLSVVGILTDGSRMTFAAGTVNVAHSGADQSAAVDPVASYAAHAFKTISVAGQSDVVADSASDTLTLAGSGITITTTPGSDTILFTATGGGGGGGGGSMTAAEILAALVTVDGTGSGLDADMLDGQSSAYYATAAALAGKAASVHAHVIADTTGLQTALNGKAATVHTHVIADTTGLQTALNGKAATAHAHAIADTTGLQTALDGKAATVHAHAIADTTGLQTALDGKVPKHLVAIVSDVGVLTAYVPSADTNIARGIAIGDAVLAAVSGDTVLAGGGAYDLGESQLALPDNVHLQLDPGTRILSAVRGDVLGAIIRPGNNSIISGGTVEGTDPDNYQFMVGINSAIGDPAKTGWKVFGVRMVGSSDCLYIAHESAIAAIVRDCEMTANYDTIYVGGGLVAGVSGAHAVDVYSPSVNITGPSPTLFGVSRGCSAEGSAVVRLFGGAIKVTQGGANVNAGVSTVNTGGTIEVYGTKIISTNSSGAPPYDLRNVAGTIKVCGGSGSGTNGAWLTTGTITYIDGNAAAYATAAALAAEAASRVAADDALNTALSGKAATAHTHNASDITAGTLAVARGGTGLTAVGAALQVLRTNAGATALEWAAAGGAGTVTSVGWTGGLVSIATATSTPAFTVAGTSGGIPYFSSATTWETSAVLAANALVIGGGAGLAPATTPTGTGGITALGVNVGSVGSFVVNGGAMGTPASGSGENITNLNGASIASGNIAAARITTALTTAQPVAATTLSASGIVTAGTAPTVLTDAAGKILSEALNTVGVPQGGTGLTFGISGGVPYYSTGSTINTSAALAANALIAGGGAGGAPVTVATGTGVIAALGVNPGSAGSFLVNGGAGGTPASLSLTNATGLPVAGGGTGAAALTAYAVLCGGTTSTGAVQPVASVGTATHVLTSNGPGALPTFQAAAGGATSPIPMIAAIWS